MVTATLTGFQAPQVRLYARYRSTAKWEEAPMLPRASGSAYEFLFAGLPEPVDYYVEAAGVSSKTYKLDVVDLAGIKKLKVTYHYPSWLGLPSVTEDPGGDLRAVAGTVAELTVETDRPLKNGTIEVDDGSHIALEAGPNGTLIAKVPINKDGMYHFAANEQGQSVRLSEDYFIEAREDQAPTVKITHPGSDAQRQPDRGSASAGFGRGRFRARIDGAALFGERHGGKSGSAAAAKGREDGHRHDHAVPGRLQAGAGRRGGGVRHGARRANHFADRYPVHRGAAVREELHAIAAGRRRRRRRRRRSGRESHLAAAEGNYRGDLE